MDHTAAFPAAGAAGTDPHSGHRPGVARRSYPQARQRPGRRGATRRTRLEATAKAAAARPNDAASQGETGERRPPAYPTSVATTVSGTLTTRTVAISRRRVTWPADACTGRAAISSAVGSTAGDDR